MSSRDVIKGGLIFPQNQNIGVLSLSWKILEQDDGLKIQIIYGGDVNLPFLIEGAIEGQPKGIQRYSSPNYIKSKGSFYSIYFPLFMVIGVSFCLWMDYRKYKAGRQLRIIMYMSV